MGWLGTEREGGTEDECQFLQNWQAAVHHFSHLCWCHTQLYLGIKLYTDLCSTELWELVMTAPPVESLLDPDPAVWCISIPLATDKASPKLLVRMLEHSQEHGVELWTQFQINPEYVICQEEKSCEKVAAHSRSLTWRRDDSGEAESLPGGKGLCRTC